MANPYSRVLSKDQYLNSFVDFYNQTLGTGISSSVAIDPTEGQENEQQNAGPNIFMGSGDDPSAFLTPTITMNSPEQVMSRATKEIAEDRNDNFFKDYNVKEQIQEFYKTDAGKFVGGVSALTGSFIPGAVFAGGIAVSEINRRAKDRAAYDVYAAGNLAGSTLNVGGQDIIRRPGSTNYIGTVTGDPKQIYAQEQINYGYIPGTMKETQGGEDDGGNWSRSGFEGLLSADIVADLKVKGNYDAYGNFYTANGQSSMGTMESGKALFESITGRKGTNTEVASFMKDFRANLAPEKSWWQNTTSMKAADYADARKTAIENLRNKYGISSAGTDTPTTTVPDSDSGGTTPDFSVPGSTVSESSDDSGSTTPTYTYSGQDSQGNTVTTSSTYDEAGMNITAPSSTSTGRTAQDDIVGPVSQPEVNISRTSSYDSSDDDSSSGGGTTFSGSTTSYGTTVSSNVGGAGEHADIGNYVTEKQKQEKSSGGSSGGGGSGNNDGCVIATHGISTGGFTLMEKAKAEIWCQKTYHGKWYGEAFRRGYRAAGQRCIDSGNAEQHYQEFKDFVGYGRGVKKGYKLAINYYLRTLQFFINGMFLGK